MRYYFYDPRQPRDKAGRWTRKGAGASLLQKLEAGSASKSRWGKKAKILATLGALGLAGGAAYAYKKYGSNLPRLKISIERPDDAPPTRQGLQDEKPPNRSATADKGPLARTPKRGRSIYRDPNIRPSIAEQLGRRVTERGSVGPIDVRHREPHRPIIEGPDLSEHHSRARAHLKEEFKRLGIEVVTDNGMDYVHGFKIAYPKQDRAEVWVGKHKVSTVDFPTHRTMGTNISGEMEDAKPPWQVLAKEVKASMIHVDGKGKPLDKEEFIDALNRAITRSKADRFLSGDNKKIHDKGWVDLDDMASYMSDKLKRPYTTAQLAWDLMRYEHEDDKPQPGFAIEYRASKDDDKNITIPNIDAINRGETEGDKRYTTAGYIRLKKVEKQAAATKGNKEVDKSEDKTPPDDSSSTKKAKTGNDKPTDDGEATRINFNKVVYSLARINAKTRQPAVPFSLHDTSANVGAYRLDWKDAVDKGAKTAKVEASGVPIGTIKVGPVKAMKAEFEALQAKVEAARKPLHEFGEQVAGLYLVKSAKENTAFGDGSVRIKDLMPTRVSAAKKAAFLLDLQRLLYARSAELPIRVVADQPTQASVKDSVKIPEPAALKPDGRPGSMLGFFKYVHRLRIINTKTGQRATAAEIQQFLQELKKMEKQKLSEPSVHIESILLSEAQAMEQLHKLYSYQPSLLGRGRRAMVLTREGETLTFTEWQARRQRPIPTKFELLAAAVFKEEL